MAHLDLSNIPATLDRGDWKPALVASSSGGSKQRVMPGNIVITVPLTTKESIDAFDALIPMLKAQMDAVAARVEDGGSALVAKAKAKVPPVSLTLRYKDADKDAKPALAWPIAESRGIDVIVDAKGNGSARTRWRVRLSKHDMGVIHDAAGADMLVSATQSQMTLDEAGKASKDNPFKRARDEKKADQQLPLADAATTETGHDDRAAPEVADD